MELHSLIALFTFICILLFNIKSLTANPRKLIIDTDAGADDAIAILLALAYERKSPENLQVVAITCTYGNTYVHNVEQNVLKTLTVANRSDMPVYIGAQKPLLNKYKHSTYFGNDGFGDFNFTGEITATVEKSKVAALALIELVKKEPGQISLLCLGPLTNIANAIALDPSFLKYTKDVFVMGASVSGIGNESPGVEFNFRNDPEANYIVLNNTYALITLFPWETTLDSAITKGWRMNEFGGKESELVAFINKAEKIELETSTLWTPADAMITAAVIWPELISKSILTNVNPVVSGEGRGTVLVDYSNKTQNRKNSRIALKFSKEPFKQILLDYLE